MTNGLAKVILEYVPKDELISAAIVNLTNHINNMTIFAITVTAIFVIAGIFCILVLFNKRIEDWTDKHSSIFFWALFALAVSFVVSAIAWMSISTAYKDLDDLNSGIEPIQLTTAINYYDWYN